MATAAIGAAVNALNSARRDVVERGSTMCTSIPHPAVNRSVRRMRSKPDTSARFVFSPRLPTCDAGLQRYTTPFIA